jgi:hypothetical protein
MCIAHPSTELLDDTSYDGTSYDDSENISSDLRGISAEENKNHENSIGEIVVRPLFLSLVNVLFSAANFCELFLTTRPNAKRSREVSNHYRFDAEEWKTNFSPNCEQSIFC